MTEAFNHSLTWPLAIGIGAFFGTLTLTVNQLLLSTHREQLTSKTPLRLLTIIFTLSLAFLVATTINLIIFRSAIEAELLVLKPTLGQGILGRIDALSKISSTTASVKFLIILVYVTVALLQFLPLLIIWRTPLSNYEKAVEAYSNSELEKLQTAVKDITNSNKETTMTQGVEKMPFGGFEIYIDYKRLPVTELKTLFASLSNLYNITYTIAIAHPQLKELFYFNVDEIFKAHPEDVLCFHAIETGNSITFQVTTGWKPKFDVEEGNFVVSLPKGALSLFIIGYIIMKMFDYGTSSYKQILEIEKLKKENKILDSQIMENELNRFNLKLNASPEVVRENFQSELANFYELTLRNKNFTHTVVKPDSALLQSIKEGKIAIDTDNE